MTRLIHFDDMINLPTTIRDAYHAYLIAKLLKIKEEDIMVLTDETHKSILDKWSAHMRMPFLERSKKKQNSFGFIYCAMHGVFDHMQHAVLSATSGNLLQIEKTARQVAIMGKKRT